MKRAAVLATVIALALAAAPAQATFPGRNGEILVGQNSGASTAYGDATLFAIDPRGRGQRTVWRCQSSAAPGIPKCEHATSPAISPDGRTVTSRAAAHG